MGFPTISNEQHFTAGGWNCIHVVYELAQDGYNLFVNQAGGNTTSSTNALPTTVAGVDVAYSGNSMSSAWIDSIVVTQIRSGGSAVTLFSQTFDNPATASGGLQAGNGSVSTPPASVAAPPECLDIMSQ